MISPLDIATHGYLCDELSIATDGYVCIKVVVEDSIKKKIIFGSNSKSLDVELEKRKYLDKQEQELILLINIFLKVCP